MPTLTLRDGGHLYYKRHGSGPPLLLVTGLGGLGSFWEPHVAAFAERFTVIVHDHRGAGQSSIARIDYSVDQMADDLLSPTALDRRGLFEAGYVAKLRRRAPDRPYSQERAYRLWTLLLTEFWARRFLDERGAAPAHPLPPVRHMTKGRASS